MDIGEKKRAPIAPSQLLEIAAETEGLLLAPLDLPILQEMVAADSCLELHDRIIVGTARAYGATLITKDVEIVASGLVQTIW